MNLSPTVQLSSVAFPNKMKLGYLDFSLPSDARSTSIKIQPSNVSQIVSATLNTRALTAVEGVATTGDELQFPVQNLNIDLPSGASPSQFVDSRFSTLMFCCQIDTTTVPFFGHINCGITQFSKFIFG